MSLHQKSFLRRIIMRTFRSLLAILSFTLLITLATAISTAQEPASTKTAVLTPATPDISVGQKVKFTAELQDAAGNKTAARATAWFAAPFDLAAVDESGTVSFFSPGEVLVGAVVGGKAVFTRVMVKVGPITRIDIESLKMPLVIGANTRLSATPRGSEGNPRGDATLSWTSNKPGVATVDGAGVVTAISPGQATISASSGSGKGSIDLTVVNSTLTGLSVEPRSKTARTGDVVRFKVHATGGQADNNAVRWTVNGPAATIDSDGGFVAELPGSYVITAASGPQEAIASVVVTPRNAERALQVVGRAPIKDFEA